MDEVSRKQAKRLGYPTFMKAGPSPITSLSLSLESPTKSSAFFGGMMLFGFDTTRRDDA